MSLKHKCEAAMLEVIRLGNLFQGQRYQSQEPGEKTLVTPCVIADATIVGEMAKNRLGMSVGNKQVRLLTMVVSPADRDMATGAGVPGDANDPAVLHALRVDQVRDSIHLTDIASRLTTAHVDFTVMAVMADPPPQLKPEQRRFVDVFAFRLFACEYDLT